MRTTPLRLLLAAALAAFLVVPTTGCDDDGPAPADPPAIDERAGEQESGDEAADAGAETDEKPTAPDADELKAQHTKRLAEMDEYGRGLLASFESRVYAPPRDGGLRSGVAVISVRVKDVEGTYRA